MLFNSDRTTIPETLYQAVKDSTDGATIRVADCIDAYSPAHVGRGVEELNAAAERAHYRAELERLSVPAEWWPEWIAEPEQDEAEPEQDEAGGE